MHRLSPLAASLAFAALALASTTSLALASRSPPRVQVLVELFTSEGCSSCPPADAVLARLAAAQSVDGVEVIALGEHVDYWDGLGWRDPFSSHDFTERQESYAAQFGSGRIYTPQAVVQGQLDVLGSDERGLRAAFEAVRDRPRGTLSVRQRATAGAVSASLSAEGLPPHGAAEAILAVVEDGLSSQVLRGENAGRTLAHAAVVRRLVRVGEARDGSFEGEARLPLDAAWKRASLRLVFFVQERQGGRILAATQEPLAAPQQAAR